MQNRGMTLRLVFNQPRCHGNSMHPCQNARINTSVINLDSCKKWAPKHKYFKSYGELGIGSLKLCSATLRWPNTVLARAFADANLHVHKDFKKQTCRQQSDHFIYSKPALSVLFFSIIACSVLMVLVFYYNDMLQKVTMQRTQHF